jgi:hypothetical protein
MGRQGWAAWAVASAVAVFLAGCGAGGRSSPPFAVSEAQVRAECMTGTFVAEEAGPELLERPPPQDWRRIEDLPEAMDAERGAVLVTLRPRGDMKKVTLTGIKFHVSNLGVRPIGSVLYRPCKKRLNGAALEADLDGFTHEVSASAESAALRVGFHLPRQANAIRFPWTVSLSKPLHLYLVVQALDIYCKWTADISWVSGSSEGVIHVDNGGKKYLIVDGQGTGWYRPGDGQWADGGSSRWIGIR